MRLRLRLLITFSVLLAAGAGTWCYLKRGELSCWRACGRVGAAETFGEAQAEIDWFETGPDRDFRLRELVARWGTGRQQFDFYLARHVGHPDSSELLRKTFSLGFGWHEERLPRWAHYWSWQTSQEPNEEIASIVRYLDLLLAADESKTITWREVLDLQAVFHLTGEPRLARRLTPDNWRNRYRDWRRRHPGELPRVSRPEEPFADWSGPVASDACEAS